MPHFAQKASYNPLMISITPGHESILPYRYLASGRDLVVRMCRYRCAHPSGTQRIDPASYSASLPGRLADPRTRGETIDEFLFHLLILTLPLFVAWRMHLLGGADLKILVVLSLANPQLTVAAWIGVMLYFLGLLILWNKRPARFAGVPGFALGIAVFTIGQMVVFFTQHPAAR